MNRVQHQLYIRNTTGDLLDIVSDGAFSSLTYTLKENEAGVLELTLPGDYDRNNLMIDGLIEIWRSTDGGGYLLEGDTAFFIRRIRKVKNEQGVTAINVLAFSAMHLMKRRLVAYFAGTSFSEKTRKPWDDMLKEVVNENYGPGASFTGASYSGLYLDGDASRNLEPWLTVEPPYHLGASFDHTMPWMNVYDVLKGIVGDVRSSGQYCSFDVVLVSPAHFEFRVFVGPRGKDHSRNSSDPVIISEGRGNLLVPQHDQDWQEEKNFIYATGQGLQDQRTVRTAQDDSRIGISPFNRQEYHEDARMASAGDTVQSDANSALETNRPKNVFAGSIVQTEGCVYRVHWGWGDIIAAEYDAQTYDCHVDTVTVSIDQSGAEVVVGALGSVQDVTR